MIGASLMILFSQFVVFTRAEPLSLVGIGSALLLWYGVYRLARAIYRKRDLTSENATQGSNGAQ
jgi:hypothetical protein